MGVREEKVKEAFNDLDKNGNGVMSAEELRGFIANFGKNLTDSEVEEMIHAADINGDSQMQFEEFVRKMPSLLGAINNPGRKSTLLTNRDYSTASSEVPADGELTEEPRLGSTGGSGLGALVRARVQAQVRARARTRFAAVLARVHARMAGV